MARACGKALEELPPVDVVLVGGGETHSHVIQMFAMKPNKKIKLTLISSDMYSVNSEMISGFLSEHYSEEACRIDLLKLCKMANCRFILAKVSKINEKKKKVYLLDKDTNEKMKRPPIAFDVLSINIGLISSFPEKLRVGNLKSYGIVAVRPHSNFVSEWMSLKSEINFLRWKLASSEKVLAEGETAAFRSVDEDCGGKGVMENEALKLNEEETYEETSKDRSANAAFEKFCAHSIEAKSLGSMHQQSAIKVLIAANDISSAELCLSMQYGFYKEFFCEREKKYLFSQEDRSKNCIQFILALKSTDSLKNQTATFEKRIKEILSKRQIEVYYGCEIIDIKQKEIYSLKEEKHKSQEENRDFASCIAITKDHVEIEFHFCVWSINTFPNIAFKDSSINENQQFGIKINAHLQSINCPFVFAAGDIAVNSETSRKNSESVHEGASCLYENINRYIEEVSLKKYAPPRFNLNLISTGDKFAVPTNCSFCPYGNILWNYKDWSNRKKMSIYNDLEVVLCPVEASSLATSTINFFWSLTPYLRKTYSDICKSYKHPYMSNSAFRSYSFSSIIANKLPSLSSLLTNLPSWLKFCLNSFFSSFSILQKANFFPSTTKSSCQARISLPSSFCSGGGSSTTYKVGGCACKMNKLTLRSTINKLKSSIFSRKEVLVGLDAPDDCALFTCNGVVDEGIMVQTVDFFKCFYDDPYIFGYISALHCLSDCFAKGAIPITALVMPTVPSGAENKVGELFFQLMSGCCDALKSEECELSGGHTCQGGELSMGLTITGKILQKNDNKRFKYDLKKGECAEVSSPSLINASFTNSNFLPGSNKNNSDPSDDFTSVNNTNSIRLSVDFLNKENIFCEENKQDKDTNNQQTDAQNVSTDRKLKSLENFLDARFLCMTKGAHQITRSHKIVLTKPIGVGIILAAYMKAAAKGSWVFNALHYMQQSNNAAAQCILSYGANACTDVTGFGLLSHLIEMIEGTKQNCPELFENSEQTNLKIFLDLNKIPVLNGALQLLKQNTFTALFYQNMRAAIGNILNVEEIQGHEVFPLLFDPQTAGGMLCFLPEYCVKECLEKLHSLNYDAKVIGEICLHDKNDNLVDLCEKFEQKRGNHNSCCVNETAKRFFCLDEIQDEDETIQSKVQQQLHRAHNDNQNMKRSEHSKNANHLLYINV